MSDDARYGTRSTAAAVDVQRRSALLAMAKALAYVPPAMATFAMGGMSARAVGSYVTNLPV